MDARELDTGDHVRLEPLSATGHSRAVGAVDGILETWQWLPDEGGPRELLDALHVLRTSPRTERDGERPHAPWLHSAIPFSRPTMERMYTPVHFVPDADASARFLSEVVAGDLVTMTDDGLVATFLPLLMIADEGGQGSLVGHLARNNDQWQRPAREEALAIVHGPDAYVTPSWYASKAEHGRVVPTWNYATAHVYGELVVHDDEAWVDALVRRLTARHEAGREHPWSVDDAPAKFHAGMLRAIVGVELVISRVEVKVKMSQNRRAADIDGVVAGLARDGLPDAAAMVERSRS